MNLIGITFHGNRPHGFPSASYCDLTTPNHILRGWKIRVRGVRVLFTPPRGWRPNLQPGQHDPKLPSWHFEMPRSTMHLHWEGDDEAMNVDTATWPAEEKGGKK
jgi:hypothetical protein